MSLTITVRMALVLLLLSSGFFHFAFASNHLRLFRRPDDMKYFRKDSLAKCNETYESFVTLYDEEDVNFIGSFVDDEFPSAWLGLRKGRNITWSNGSHVKFNKSSVHALNGEQVCEAIDNSTWRAFNCTDKKYFMCYKDDNYTLVENNKTWCQALQHCRKHFNNLVSISNITENENVIKKGNNATFWIGLMHDEWEWEDKGCSSFRKWANQNVVPGEMEECTVRNKDNPKSLYKFGCTDSNALPLCSKGIMRIRVINQTLTWEQAFDYCKANHTGMLWIEDAEDQEAVEQWLGRTNGNGQFWIGLRQSRLLGHWIWSDRIVTYSNWKNGTQPELPMSNHCGAINKTDYTWSDEDCRVQLPFLCEEEIVYMN